MHIAIPSMGRADKQVTLKHIPNKWLRKTALYVPQKEFNAYCIAVDPTVEVLGVPNKIKGIAKTRKYIMDNCTDNAVLMLDDDMDFCYRPSMHEPDLITITSAIHMNRMFSMIEKLLKKYAAVGLSARQGNNRINEQYRVAGRMMNAYAFNIPVLNNLNIKFGRIPVMEDFDITLQMLRKGYPNAVIYKYCWNQRSSNAKGGCSLYRDNAMQSKAAYQLKKFHPNFVKVVTKKSSSTWKGMEERIDVNIRWRKAYASSQED